MSSSFSSFEAQQIIRAAQAALKTIDAIIEEQERYAKEIAELYGQLLDQSGNALAKSIKLVRVSPGKYRTLAGGKRGGTKSNLYLAAKSGAGATVQTHSGTYDAQECYKRALDLAGIDEYDDAFEDLVFAGYKKWLHGEIIEKPLPEWKAMRLVVAEAIEAAEPALQGGLARLFMSSTTKQAAFDALDKLQKMDVAHIVSHMDYWPTFSAERFSSKEALVYCFRHDEEDRDNILGCLQKEIGDFKLGGDDSRLFSSEEAQQALDRFQGIADVPASIAAAQGDVKNGIPSAIDEMRESDVLAQLALIPIDELGKQGTGVQIKRLQDAGVTTLADLYERLSSPEKGDLPGVGPKIRGSIEAYLDPIVADIQKRWRLELAADDKSDAAVRLLRTVQAYLELDGLYEKAQSALASLEPLSDTQIEALRCAADPIDWLLADDERVHAAGCAMEAANKQLESEDGTWLASMLDGSEVRRLVSNLAHIGEARKAFRAHPDAFMKIIGDVAPEVLAPAESAVADAASKEAAAPAKQQKRKTAAKKKSQQPTSAKTGTDLLEQTEAFYKKFEGATMMFLSAEDAPVFDASSKYSVSADAPRAQGDTFSCAIPDGWTSEGDTGGRAFVLVPKGHAGKGLLSDVAILYGKAPVVEDYASSVRQYGIPAILWAFRYIGRSYSASFTTEMHEVTARNCRCAVVQVPTSGKGCFEFYVYPYSLIGQDYLRITFYVPDDVTYEQARTFADDLARTVEIDGLTTPACLERLEDRFMAAGSAMALNNEVCAPTVLAANALTQEVMTSGLRYHDALHPSASTKAQAAAALCALDQFGDMRVPYVDKLTDLLEQWVRRNPQETKEVGRLLDNFRLGFTVYPEMFEGLKGSYPEFVDELLALIEPTPKQRALLDRIDALRASLGLTADENADNEQSGSVEPQESELAPAQGEGMDLVTFFLTFLSKSWFFFDEGDIAWDGSHHSIRAITWREPCLEQIEEHIEGVNVDFDGLDDVRSHFLRLVLSVEQDEGIRVPRGCVAPGVKKALPEGDLTGLTLVNLCESSQGLVFGGGYDRYEVCFDTRLSRGIPQFFSLVARTLWDLRECMVALKGRPFDIVFLATRSFDADEYLGEVDNPVTGAQECPMLMHVTDKPEIDLS